MDWKFIMCLLVMCSTTIWKLLEILTYGEIQVRQVDETEKTYSSGIELCNDAWHQYSPRICRYE